VRLASPETRAPRPVGDAPRRATGDRDARLGRRGRARDGTARYGGHTATDAAGRAGREREHAVYGF
jgi:hypothetical protein